MFGYDDDIFGDIFDLDGDGKTSFWEAFTMHELFLSDEELKLEYGESDDDTFSSEEAEEDDDDYEEDYHAAAYDDFEHTDKEDYYTTVDDDFKHTDKEDYYTAVDDNFEDSDDESDDEDEDNYGSANLTVPVNISFTFGSNASQDAVQRSDYPNERTYKAADLLDSIERYPDIYNNSDYSEEIEKCHFILDNQNVTAAKYLNYQHGFLFAQAVKERFKLPISIPDDDENIHTPFPKLFSKISRYNIEYAIRIWHWVLTMFSPYIKFGESHDADKLTSSVMCDIYDNHLIDVAVYAQAHPHFITVFLNTMPNIPFMTEKLICICIQNNAKNAAKALFEGCLSTEKIEYDEKERFVSSVLENVLNSDEIETVKFFRDVMLPIVIKYADKPMKRKMSEWQSYIAEYIKESTEETGEYEEESETDWRESCAYMRKSGIEPNNYESEAECRKAYQEAREAERRKQQEQHDAEMNRLLTLCKEIENGEKTAQYIYCAVLLPSVPRPYHYRTTDKNIKIGDKVIVPVGEDNKEMTGIVASLEIHTELTVPFPIDKTKQIIRKV